MDDTVSPTGETKIIYHLDDEETPYLIKLPIASDFITLAHLKQFILHDRQALTGSDGMDDDFGVVKEEIVDDKTRLPSFSGRVICWIMTNNLVPGTGGMASHVGSGHSGSGSSKRKARKSYKSNSNKDVNSTIISSSTCTSGAKGVSASNKNLKDHKIDNINDSNYAHDKVMKSGRHPSKSLNKNNQTVEEYHHQAVKKDNVCRDSESSGSSSSSESSYLQSNQKTSNNAKLPHNNHYNNNDRSGKINVPSGSLQKGPPGLVPHKHGHKPTLNDVHCHNKQNSRLFLPNNSRGIDQHQFISPECEYDDEVLNSLPFDTINIGGGFADLKDKTDEDETKFSSVTDAAAAVRAAKRRQMRHQAQQVDQAMKKMQITQQQMDPFAQNSNDPQQHMMPLFYPDGRNYRYNGQPHTKSKLSHGQPFHSQNYDHQQQQLAQHTNAQMFDNYNHDPNLLLNNAAGDYCGDDGNMDALYASAGAAGCFNAGTTSVTESVVSLNVINVTLHMDATVNFLGISIVGSNADNTNCNKNRAGHKNSSSLMPGISVGSVMKGGAVARDGRIDPGDIILEVNNITLDGLSSEEAIKVLRDAVKQPGPVRLLVAKSWGLECPSIISPPLLREEIPSVYPYYQESHTVDEHFVDDKPCFHGNKDYTDNTIESKKHKNLNNHPNQFCDADSKINNNQFANQFQQPCNLNNGTSINNINNKMYQCTPSNNQFCNNNNNKPCAPGNMGGNQHLNSVSNQRQNPTNYLASPNLQHTNQSPFMSEKDSANKKMTFNHQNRTHLSGSSTTTTSGSHNTNFILNNGHGTVVNGKQINHIRGSSSISHPTSSMNNTNNVIRQSNPMCETWDYINGVRQINNCGISDHTSQLNMTQGSGSSTTLSDVDRTLLSIVTEMCLPNSGLEIKDRTWLKLIIKDAFLGSDLVEWLASRGYRSTSLVSISGSNSVNTDTISSNTISNSSSHPNMLIGSGTENLSHNPKNKALNNPVLPPLTSSQRKQEARKLASILLKKSFIKHSLNKTSFSEQCYYIINKAVFLNPGSYPSTPNLGKPLPINDNIRSAFAVNAGAPAPSFQLFSGEKASEVSSPSSRSANSKNLKSSNI